MKIELNIEEPILDGIVHAVDDFLEPEHSHPHNNPHNHNTENLDDSESDSGCFGFVSCLGQFLIDFIGHIIH